MTKGESTFIAVTSYLTLIGWIVALILHNKNTTKFGQFHLRQSLPLHFLAIVFALVPLLQLLNVLVLILMIIGIIYAAQHKKKFIPLIGAYANDLLSDL